MIELAIAWYACGWVTLGAFCKWGADEEMRLCDVLLIVATGPGIPILMPIIIAALFLMVGIDYLMKPICEHIPSIKCPVVWKRTATESDNQEPI